MSIPVKQGEKLPLRVTLADGDVLKFPLAYVTDDNDLPISGSPFELDHIGNGTYTNHDFTVALQNKLYATYVIFDDAGHTVESHERSEDVFNLEKNVADFALDVLVGEISEEDQELIGYLDDEEEELIGFIQEV